MVDKNKILHLNTIFTKSEPLPTANGKIDSINISGYASTNDVDRASDVIPTAVWEKGLENYLKNPVILAYHKHDEPVGRMTEHRVDEKGLWITARISAAAEDVFNLVKDGVITAFSVGFKIIDAEYNAAAELFIVKELELHEISVVSVPANQNTLFSLSKSFATDDEFKSFKMQFAPKSESAKGLESSTEAEGTITKEFDMNQEELKQLLAETAKSAAAEATKALAEKQAAEKSAQEAQAKAEAELDAKIKSAVASIQVGDSGAERLLAEVEKRFAEQTEQTKGVIEGLESAIKEKAAELEAIQKSKMQFQDGTKSVVEYTEREAAVLLSKMTGKSIEATTFGRSVIEKAGAHVPSATWEKEVSLRMEDEVRRRLVVAPLFRNIAMQTNVMTIPVNPEAGVATWVTNAQFGTTNSAGAAQTHQLAEITLNAYKVATSEYVAFEEQEDSLLALMPVIRDAMVRRVARAVDRAFLRGAGSGSDPVKGLAAYDTTSAVNLDISNGDVATVATMRSLRQDLGLWGLDPADVVYVVSSDVYYELLNDSIFQTMDKVGPQATLLTGQIGMIGNSPVLVSSEFEGKDTGAVGAIALAPANFLVGNQRGLRVDTQDLVETQRKVLVASLRTGLVQTTTNQGQGVSALRYVA